MPWIIRLFSRVATPCCIVLGRLKSILHRLGAERRSDGALRLQCAIQPARERAAVEST